MFKFFLQHACSTPVHYGKKIATNSNCNNNNFKSNLLTFKKSFSNFQVHINNKFKNTIRQQKYKSQPNLKARSTRNNNNNIYNNNNKFYNNNNNNSNNIVKRFFSKSYHRSYYYYSIFNGSTRAPAIRQQQQNKHGLFSFLKLVFPGITAAGGCNFYNFKKGSVLLEAKESKDTVNELKGKKTESPPKTIPLKVLFKLILPDLFLLILAVATAFSASIISVRIPKALGGLVNLVTAISKDGVLDMLSFKAQGQKILVLYVVSGVLSALYIALLGFVGERLAFRLRSQLFDALVQQDMGFFDANRSGDLVSRLANDVQEFKSSFKQSVSQGLKSFTQFVGSIGALYAISPKLTGVMVIALPVMVGLGSLIGHFLRVLSRQSQKQHSEGMAVAGECLGNIKTVKAFAMEDIEIKKFNEEMEKSCQLNELLNVGVGLFQGVSSIAINFMSLVVLYSGGILVSEGELTGGDLMSFLISTQTIQKSLSRISLLFGSTIRGMVAGGRVYEFLEAKPEITTYGGRELAEISGSFEFRNVSFSYPTRPNQQVLKSINLNLESGKVLALCGTSGSGKSTIASLIERFYDPQSGTILLDGVDIRELNPRWLRKVIGYIGQEPILFHTSIFENIRYGNPEATPEQVRVAAKQANADNFIRDFPHGYHTVVGERGVTLSGGQRQRIAIARALLKNPKILILDEATSALDTESERLVQDALDKVLKNRTVLVIAHRLSTISSSDVICVMQHGQVVESGSHEVLIKKNGFYASLVQRQLNSGSEVIE